MGIDVSAPSHPERDGASAALAAPGRAGRPRRRQRRRLTYLAGGITVLLALGWLGLRIPPRPLPDPGLAPGPVTTIPLPDGLPGPVDRFYRTLYGDEVPVVDSMVVTGRGTMRVNGITFPARFRFSHVTGMHYRHYIEVAAFGLPIMTVDEWFLDGVARLELPFGVMEGPTVDQGANLALWAEAAWVPAVWLTAPRTSWTPVDDTTAELTVPFGASAETFTVHFDPETGLLSRMETLRFKGEDEAKTRWSTEARAWGEIDGQPTATISAVTWADEGSPWTILHTEQLLLNADLDAYVRDAGP